MKYFLLIGILIGTLVNGFISICYANNLTVAFEPFPPFIKEDGTGFTVDMLRAIEKISDLTFDVHIMTYARAKNELKHHRIDIAGHTPKNLETNEFYQYAQELNWQIETTSDLFSFDPLYFDYKNIKPLRIGTTSGNAAFFAQQIGIDKSYFLEVRSLEQAVNMLIKHRIDVLLFERASVMTLLEQKKIHHVHYKSIGIIPASMAVNNDENGLKLKEQLDTLIDQLNIDEIFSQYLKYKNLPQEGVMPVPLSALDN